VARQWLWGIGAVAWLGFTVGWGFWPRSEQTPYGVAECHVPWLAVFGSLAVALVGSWWIADLREHPHFPKVFGVTLVVWLLLALAWPLVLGNTCDSAG
jgi:hypothetical protein